VVLWDEDVVLKEVVLRVAKFSFGLPLRGRTLPCMGESSGLPFRSPPSWE
jgi:hypothetical protein